MRTSHKIYFTNSQEMQEIEDESVNLVLTSPPYPMIEIWDDLFCNQNSDIKTAFEKGDGLLAFELMHKELDLVWDEVYRILKSGGLACINIGDATRRIGDEFMLYSSHSRILSHCIKIGFSCLPSIIWTKQTNAPTKFMGSGMLPPGAYVTLEHENILILRKGKKREFETEDEKEIRRESTYFWEERNLWFSDLWDLRGIPQALEKDNLRERSAAFPFELAYRLISMFSIKEDMVLDPFIGTGTTMLAAMASARNSIGLEINEHFYDLISSSIKGIVEFANKYNKNRIQKHADFVKKNPDKFSETAYINQFYNLPVTTKQEVYLKLNELREVKEISKNHFQVEYED